MQCKEEMECGRGGGRERMGFFSLLFLSFDLRVGIPLEELWLCCVQSTRSVTQPADNGCSPPLITRSHQSGTSACISPVVSQVNYSSAVPDSLMFFSCPPAPFLLCPSFFCLLLLLFSFLLLSIFNLHMAGRMWTITPEMKGIGLLSQWSFH